MSGYTKIVQYGDIVEIYEYDSKIKQKPPSHFKAWQIQKDIKNNGRNAPFTKNQKRVRQEKKRKEAIQKGIYQRSKQSIKRSKLAFFRLCHHNIKLSKTVHFLTFTFAYDLTQEKAKTYIKRTMVDISESYKDLPIRYISVPEYTKKNRIHYHLLVFDLPPETAKNERITRNIQRKFHRGYVDIRLATYTSEGIAGYMAKYLSKSFKNSNTPSSRGYTTSRNIVKYHQAGSNSLSIEEHIPYPDQIADLQQKEYKVPYLGNCKKTIIKKL